MFEGIFQEDKEYKDDSEYMEDSVDKNIKTPAGPRRWILRISLMVWMLGVMLVSLLVFQGPVVSSIVKRVGWAREIHDAVAAFFGAA